MLAKLKEATKWQLMMPVVLEQEPIIATKDSGCGMFIAKLQELMVEGSRAIRIKAGLAYAESAAAVVADTAETIANEVR